MPTPMANTFLQELETELHQLCQPVTALQCRLELGRILLDPQSLLEAVDGSLIETPRIFAGVNRLREKLLQQDILERESDPPPH